VSVELDVAAGVPMLPYRFMNIFVSGVGVYTGCCWLSAVAAASCGIADVAAVVFPAAAVLPAAGATIGFAVDDVVVPEVPDATPDMLLSVWLMEIS